MGNFSEKKWTATKGFIYPISRVNVQVKKMTKYNFGFEEEEEDCYCDDCECEDCEDEE